MNVDDEDTLGAVERVQQSLRENIVDSTRMIGEAQQSVDRSRTFTSFAMPAQQPDNDSGADDGSGQVLYGPMRPGQSTGRQ